MTRVLIIADDLTGAADCGVACGSRAVLHLGRPDRRPEDAEVVAIDAGTRSMPSEQAAETISSLVADLVRTHGPLSNPVLLFKKLDSTLRGHVAAELAAALHARRRHATQSGKIVALFAPAFPARGRTTVQGRQMVDGQFLEDIDWWPGVRPCSSIAAILSECGLSSGNLELALIRSGPHSLADAMIRLAGQVDVIVCDAETDADLEAIAHAATVLHPETVWAGSAGLARQLPRAANFASAVGSPSPTEYAPARISGPTLFVAGSPATVSREQARVLAAEPGIATFTVSLDDLLLGRRSSARSDYARFISEKLEHGADVFLQPDPRGSCSSEQSQLLARSLARLTEPSSGRAGALVATGGETARAILDAWGIRRLRLLGEVEPGLPWSLTEGWNRTLVVLTKAGGFGTPDSLLRCRRFLQAPGTNPLR